MDQNRSERNGTEYPRSGNGAPNTEASGNTGDAVFFGVPVLRSDVYSPVSVFKTYLSGAAGDKGSQKSRLSFCVSRDLSCPIRSFTMSFELDILPGRALNCVYDSADINEKEYITFSGNIPEMGSIGSCTAYITEVIPEEGEALRFSASDYRRDEEEKCALCRVPVPKEPDGFPAVLYSMYSVWDDGVPTLNFIVKKDLPKNDRLSPEQFTVSVLFGGTDGASPDGISEEDAYDYGYLCTEEDGKEEFINYHGKIPREVGEAGGGKCTAYVSYVRLKNGKEYYYSASDYFFEAEEEPEEEGSGEESVPAHRGWITALLSLVMICLIAGLGVGLYSYLGTKNTVEKLAVQGRYTEASMIAKKHLLFSLADKLLVEGCEDSLTGGDYESAYVYASAVSDEYADEIAGAALYRVMSADADVLGSGVFRTARKVKNDSEYDKALNSLYDTFKSKGDYLSAMHTAESIRDDELRMSLTGEIISLIAGKSGTEDSDTNVEDTAAHYIETVYPLLTVEQKRAYHAQKFTLSDDWYLVGSDGTLNAPRSSDADRSLASLTNVISADNYGNHTVVLNTDGSVASFSRGILISSSSYYSFPGENFEKRSDAVAVAAGKAHTLVLYADGTVYATGDNSFGQCDVSGWRDVVSVCAGRFFSVGLRSDGTLVACGSNVCSQCDVGDYHNVIDVRACDQTTVILFSDGTVRLQGDRSGGLADAEKFTGISELRAGGSTVAAKKRDGSFVVADGCISGSSGNADMLNEAAASGSILYFDVGEACIGYITSNGDVTVIGDGAPKK